MKMIGRVSLSLLVLALVSHFLHGYAARSSQLQTGNGIPVNPKAVENLHRRNLIVGGSAVDISSYPWAVFIGARRGAVTSGHCTGSLISPGVVLTAAHCVFHESGRLVMSVSMLRVYIGATDWREAQVVRGVKSVQAPAWQGWVGDFSLLYLDECLPHGHPTVKLATPEGSLGKDQTAANLVGWGVSDTGASQAVMSPTLRHLETSTALVTECRNVAASWSLQYDSAKELCFASLPIGAGICSGDSGAPIVSYSNDIGEWVQVGVAAYGPGICGSGPDFAVRVSHFVETLVSLVSKDECVRQPELLRQQLLDNPGPVAPPSPSPPPPLPSPPPPYHPPSPPPPSPPPTNPPTPVFSPPPPPPKSAPTPGAPPDVPAETPSPTESISISPTPTKTTDTMMTHIPLETPMSSQSPTPVDTPTVAPVITTPPPAVQTDDPTLAATSTPTPVPSTTMPSEAMTPSPTVMSPNRTCPGSSSTCPGEMVLRKDDLLPCMCVWPMVVSFKVTVAPTEWDTEWDGTLLEAVAQQLAITAASQVYLEQAVSISQHEEMHATLTVTFLVIPHPEDMWNRSEIRVAQERLQNGSVFLGIQDIDLIEVKDLAVYSRGDSAASLSVSQIAGIVSGAVIGAIILGLLLLTSYHRTWDNRQPDGGLDDEADNVPLAQSLRASTLRNPRNWLRISMGSLEIGTGWFQAALSTPQSSVGAWEELSCNTQKISPCPSTTTDFDLHEDSEKVAFADAMPVYPVECRPSRSPRMSSLRPDDLQTSGDLPVWSPGGRNVSRHGSTVQLMLDSTGHPSAVLSPVDDVQPANPSEIPGAVACLGMQQHEETSENVFGTKIPGEFSEKQNPKEAASDSIPLVQAPTPPKEQLGDDGGRAGGAEPASTSAQPSSNGDGHSNEIVEAISVPVSIAEDGMGRNDT